jgi:hypothetical protein
MISTRTRSAVEALSLGLYRMLVKGAAVLLAAACTHLPTERKRLLARRGKQTRVGGGSLFIVGQKSPRSGLELAPGVPLPTGALLLDGYGSFDGSLLVSSWVTGKIYLVGRSGKDIETVVEVKGAVNSPPPDGPADLNIDQRRNRLLLPLFNANQLSIIPFKD